jgi:hypothetical protein
MPAELLVPNRDFPDGLLTRARHFPDIAVFCPELSFPSN